MPRSYDAEVVGAEWPAAAGWGWPFAPAATFADRAGAAVPADLLADLLLYPAGAAGPLYLASLARSAVGVRVGFADDSGAEVCSALVPAGWAGGPVGVWDGLGRSAGVLVPGPGLDRVTGSRAVGPAGLPVAAAACQPHPAAGGVAALVDPDGEGHDGVVRVVAGEGVVAAVTTGVAPDGRTATVVTFSAVGDPHGGSAGCTGGSGGGLPATPVRVIRVEGLAPDGRHVSYDLGAGPAGTFPLLSTAGGVAAGAAGLTLSRGLSDA